MTYQITYDIKLNLEATTRGGQRVEFSDVWVIVSHSGNLELDTVLSMASRQAEAYYSRSFDKVSAISARQIRA